MIKKGFLISIISMIFVAGFSLEARASTFAGSMTNNIVVAITDTGFGFINEILANVINNSLTQNYLDLLFRRFTDDDNYSTPVEFCWEGKLCYQDDNGDTVCSSANFTGSCEAGSPAASVGTTGCDDGQDDYMYCKGWEPDWLMDECMDIPLLGNVCFAVQLQNIDSDPWVVQYDYSTPPPNGSNAVMYSTEGTETDLPDTCFPYDTSDTDDAIHFHIFLKDIELELRFGRPWTAPVTSDPNWLAGPASTRCDDYIYVDAKAGTSLYCPNPPCGVSLDVELAPALQHKESTDPHTQYLNICMGDIYVGAQFQYDWQVPDNCECLDGADCTVSSGTNQCPDSDGDGYPDYTDAISSTYADPTTVGCSDLWCDCDATEQLTQVVPFFDAEFRAWFDSTISSALDQYVGCTRAFDLTSTLQNPYYDPVSAVWRGGITHPIGYDYIGYDVAANAWYCYRPWGGSYNGGMILGQLNIDTYWLNALNVDPRLSSNWVCDPCYNGAGTIGCVATSNFCSDSYIEVITDYAPVLVLPPTTFTTATDWYTLPFTGNTVGTAGYDIGVALHEQVVSEIIYEVLRDGIMSITLDRDTPTIGESLTSVLNTDVFGFFLPDLPQKEPDRDMRISVVPMFEASLNADKTRAYTTEAATSIPTASGGTFYVYNDLIMRVPHMYLDFWVDTQASGWQKIFRMELDLFIGVGLDIERCGVVNPPVCDTTTAFRIFAGFVLDPTVLNIVETTNTVYPTSADYEKFMGDILPILLSGIMGANMSVTLDISPLIKPAQLSITAPVIGAAGDTTPDDDPAGNYFAMYIDLWQSGIDAKFVFDILEGLSDLNVGSLGLAPPSGDLASETSELSSSIPETIITEVKPIDDVTYGAYFTAVDDKTPASEIQYSYRIDNGVWSPFFKSDNIAFPVIREGTHRLEVMAKDTDGFIDATPAVYTFRVDRVGPHLATIPNIPAEVHERRLEFQIYAHDWQAPDDKVTVSYNLDEKGWTEPTLNRKVVLENLDLGIHTLRIRAFDDLGNVSEIKYRFMVTDGVPESESDVILSSFGCVMTHSTGNTGMMVTFLMMLVFVGGFYLKMRRG